ncbi:MAG: PucR family transcriptional regulator [Actinobacteria bacterium]|nr:MAG: PucR family transcriptional regulator [Actinomycetota bacterium]
MSPAAARKARAQTKAKPVPDRDAPPTTLRQLLDNLGPSVGQIVAAPRGLDIPVGEPLIYDPLERSAVDRDSIVLAVGTPAEGQAARRVIADAAAAGAALVVFKLHEGPSATAHDAEEAGMTVLAVPGEMSWTHLFSLLTRAMPLRDEPAGGSGIAGVPMGDLFALANAIAAMVGGAVTIEDPKARVLAYSNLEGQRIDEPRQRSILGRQVPDMPGVRALYRSLAGDDSVHRFDTVEGLEIYPRLAVPVRVADETLGSIWVVEGTKRLGKDAERALLEAARVAALHMIHVRSSRDIERRMRGDLLRSLLEGRGSAESILERLGIDPRVALAVVAFELQTDALQEDLHRERLVDLVALYCEAFRRRAACVSIARTVYALLPAPRSLAEDRIETLAQEIVEHASSTLHVPIRAAIGSTVTGARMVPRARAEADRVLRVLAAGPGSPTVATIADVGSRAVLLELHEVTRDHPDLARGQVQAVVAYDAEHGTDDRTTLQAYLDAFGDIRTASARIGVHPNTFRYRLRRLVELFGIKFSDPDDRLVLGLQLRLLRYAAEPGSDRPRA